MNKVKIVTDSGCDLPMEVVEELRITVVPLVLRFGEEEFLDGKLSVEEFYRRMEEGQHHPETSQPSIGMFEEVFAKVTADGAEVVCPVLTSKYSGTFNSAWAAAQRFEGKVMAFDSLSLSWGLGFQVLAAAEAAQRGKGVREILRILEDIRERTHMFIVLDTIENIKRGGRADKIIPVLERVARFLNIKPIINVVEGELKLLGSARSYQGALRKIRDKVKGLASLEKLAVVHTRNFGEAWRFAQALAAATGFPRDEIPVTETGVVLASHGGPRVMGVVAVSER